MKEEIKNKIRYIIPPIFLEKIFRINSCLNKRKYRSVLKKNLILENKFSGKSCIILGTAPSIKNYNLDKIKNKYVFFLNNFYLHERFEKIEENNHSFYLTAPIHPPQTEKDWERDYLNIIKNTSKNTLFFFGLDNKKLNVKKILEKKLIDVEGRKINYYIAGNYFSPYKTKIQIPRISNVLFKSYCASLYAIQVAISLGFKKIYLLGIDHNYFNINTPKKYRFYKQTQNQKKEKELDNTLNHIRDLFPITQMYNSLNQIEGINIINLSKESILKFLDYEEYSNFIK